MESLRILVTGGTGCIGGALSSLLRSRGYAVLSCDVRHHEGEMTTRCDVGSYRQIEKLFEKHEFDCVYHLAAEFGRQNGEDYYENLWMANAVGTKNMIRLQEELSFKMVFTSISEIYGDFEGVMTEDVPDKVPIRQMNDYAISKWVNEMQIMNSARDFGTETVRVRLFNTYGPGEYYSKYRSAICVFIYKALHKQPYTVYLNHRRTSSYIDDTVNTLANIVTNFRAGEVYNIAGDELHDMKMVSDIILEELDLSDSLVKYEESETATTRDKIVDNTKSRKELGHKSTVPLKEGIKRTIQWQKEVYGIE
jgi:dTDP-glucose 4,6-dehydratase